ncbi:MAG: NosD domain-containing protein [Thermoplasmata archaeon]
MTISCNTFCCNDCGLYLDSSVNNSIFNNWVFANINGIYLYSSSNYNSIFRNNASDNEASIYLHLSDNNTIDNNTCVHNTKGIYLHCASYNTLAYNYLFEDIEDGFYLYFSDNNTFLNTMQLLIEDMVSIFTALATIQLPEAMFQIIISVG